MHHVIRVPRSATAGCQSLRQWAFHAVTVPCATTGSASGVSPTAGITCTFKLFNRSHDLVAAAMHQQHSRQAVCQLLHVLHVLPRRLVLWRRGNGTMMEGTITGHHAHTA